MRGRNGRDESASEQDGSMAQVVVIVVTHIGLWGGKIARVASPTLP